MKLNLLQTKLQIQATAGETQMNRHPMKIKIALAVAAMTLLPLMTYAADEKPSAAATPATRGSDKVDLKKLEDKYWSAKDDDYGVIQNRTFSKTGKYYFSAVYGPLVNDSFTKSRAAGGMIGYYFSEDFGIEASYLSYSSSKNDSINAVETLGAAPDYSLIKANKTLSLTYTPFYSKMAFMNKSILYFDMGFTLGAGMTDYEIQKVYTTGGVDSRLTEAKSSPHFEIGVMQQLFINKNFAFRLDIKNTFYSQKTQAYKLTSPAPESSRTESTKSGQDTTITLGLTLFTN